MLKKLFRQMSVAQILSSMTVILCLLIDSIMIGRFLGVDAMAAYGLSNPLLLAFAAIGSMISAGVQVLCSKSIGKGNKDETNAHFSITVVTCGVVAVVGVILVILFRAPLAQMLGAGDSGYVYQLTKDYLLGFIIGAPAFLFSTVLVPFLQLSGKQTRLVIAVVVMTISDVAFDALNVFVFHGGMFGMGIASSLSYYLAIGVGILYFFQKDCMFHFSIQYAKWKRCKELLVAGIPTIINMLSLVLLTFVLNRILLSISGNLAVAAYSIIATISNICYAFCSGIAGVALMLSGVFFGEEDQKSLRVLIRIMIRNAIVVDAIVTIVVLILAPLLVKLFMADNVEAASMATLGARLFVLSLVPSSINTAFKHFYQGTGRIRLTEFISVLQNFACIAFFAFLLSIFWGTTGVWLGYLCGELSVLLFVCINAWTRRGRISFSAGTFSLLNPNFGIPDEKYLYCALQTPAQVTKVSDTIYQYCTNHNLPPVLCEHIRRCVEELCTLIISRGFEDNKTHTIDIRLFSKKKEIILRFRDDCDAFNPKKHVSFLSKKRESATPQHPFQTKMSYSNSMSLNNVAITIKK